MNTTESLYKAFQIIGELMNEDCFYFIDVATSSYCERKDYLRHMVNKFFIHGEVNLGGIVNIHNIDEFFKNEVLIADIILFMDEDIYNEFIKENKHE